MRSTMQDFPLTIGSILRFGQEVYGDSEVVTLLDGGERRRRTYTESAARAARLANGLRELGIDGDQRVATFMWNNAEHLEAYLAVPSMGAVLHTLNIRLFPEQLTYVINHAQDRVVIVDDSLVPVLAKVAPDLETVEHFIVVGDGDATALGDVLRYHDLIAAEPPEYDWPEIDERAAAA
ncbi:MAG TPA: AMP-binding protein, partial [Mycobacteriales bacterium]|nr:AMP-binding protein [Mycobacteriales bacterium]